MRVPLGFIVLSHNLSDNRTARGASLLAVGSNPVSEQVKERVYIAAVIGAGIASVVLTLFLLLE
jgi:hypothetical protein